MAQGDKNLPVKLVVVEATKIEGEHVEVGAVLNNTPTDLAFELGAAGKVRVWSKELEADMKARAKAEAAAAAKRAEVQQGAIATFTAPAVSGFSAEDMTAAVQAGIAQGIEAGLKLLAEVPPAADPAPDAEGDGSGKGAKD